MDFQRLLDLASERDKVSSEKLETSKTGFDTHKFAPPKRMPPKPKVKVKKKTGPEVSNDAVKSFLQKKQAEVKAKAEEEVRKKRELLKLREESKHNTKAHAMATRTKDNLKTYNGPPPESMRKSSDKGQQVANGKHKQFIDSVEKLRQREEAKARKVDEMLSSVKVSSAAPIKRKKSAPSGPMSFEQLLQQAQKNKNKPLKAESGEESDGSEEDREEMLRRKRRERDEMYYQKTPTRKLQKMARRMTEEWEREHGKRETPKVETKTDRKYAVSVGTKKQKTGDRESSVPCKKPLEASVQSKPSHSNLENSSTHKHFQNSKLASTHAAHSSRTNSAAKPDSKPKNKTKEPPKYVETNHNVLVCTKSKPAPPPQSPWDRIYSEIQRNKPTKPASKRPKVIDSDEEYDSDMADFIDDGPDGDENVSSYIKEIFGYDRTRYRCERDDDLRDMESNFVTQMKEEKMSARLGLKEDLEDMRQEQEQLRRQAKKKSLK